MNRYELMRYERGLTQEQVGAGSGVPTRTVRSLEDGNVARPSARTAKALADFYGMTVREFLGLDDDQERVAA